MQQAAELHLADAPSFQAPAWATAIVNDGKDGHEWQARQEEAMVAYRGQAVAAAVESGV